jgi:hypothetical protein
VPAEPADGDASALRVAVRLPEGSRAQRRFSRADTVAALNDWVASLSPAAAVRPFALSQMGAQLCFWGQGKGRLDGCAASHLNQALPPRACRLQARLTLCRPAALSSNAGPGAPVLADASASLESVGVAGAMLVVRWDE